MKKTLLTLIAVTMLISATAENNIQDEFFGCKLGVSTRSQVEKVMHILNYEFIQEDSTTATIYYKGKFNIAGVELQKLIFKFTNDTLYYFSCVEDFDYTYEYSRKIEKKLSEKYNELEVADSTFYANIHRINYDKNVTTWSRRNNGMVVFLFTTDTEIQCVFAIEPMYAINIDKTTNELKQLSASYDSINQVKGVGGVRFGDDIYSAKVILERKSSTVGVLGNKLLCTNTTIGGTIYNSACFVFYNDFGLQKVMLLKEFALWERHDAEIYLESILRQYKSKYTNFKVHKDEKDSKTYSCGMYESDYDYPPIFIIFNKDSDVDAYQIVVSYYIHKPDFNNDDEI